MTAIGVAERRAPYASDPALTRGRLVPEPPSPTRTEFQRDRDRIVHSTAFRRLAHKTQVFVAGEGDHYRTRLTHTIEVAQVARAIARALRIDEDLTEGLALAHDLGHPPFGHPGEDALDACMADFGGFDHNAQALRVVTRLERRYGAFDGLNLTWEALEGLVKHNGPLIDADGRPVPRYAARGIPQAIQAYAEIQDLRLSTLAPLEAQAAAIADDIAYDCHDLDDGLRSGLLSLEDLNAVPILAEILAEVRALYPRLDPQRTIYEVTRRLMTKMIEDVIETARSHLDRLEPASPDDVREAGAAIVTFSPAMANEDAMLKAVLFTRLYRHHAVMAVRADAQRILRDLFARLMETPSLMPADWCGDIDVAETSGLARRVCDYIAGMTDRFAVSLHRQLFDDTPELR